MSQREFLSAVVLSRGRTPTTDYFLTPTLERLGYVVTLLDGEHEPCESAFDVEGCRLVVISRYVSACWFGMLQRMRQQGAKLVYFMDDDLFDLGAWKGLPWRYRWKLFTEAWIYRSRLMRICDEFWVSTPYLAEKYSKFSPQVIESCPSMRTLANEPRVRICYHGTASHPNEIAWLLPIVESVQARSGITHFEFFGTHQVSKRFGCLPRISVINPMSWSNYLAYTSAQQCDIALAPLLPGLFNAARGPTKFYDYARMGAVGLYSNVAPYRGFVRDGVDGLLLENDPAAWIDAILMLVQDVEKRNQLASEARRRSLDLIHSVS